VEDILFSLAAGAALVVTWWKHGRVTRRMREQQPTLSTDAEVALHLARHEAQAHESLVVPMHILYALVQDEGIASAIRKTGGDVDALEDHLFSAVDKATTDVNDPAASERFLATQRVYGWAVFHARQSEREVTTTDLWGGLVHAAPDVVSTVEAAGISAASVLFTLVHGTADELPALERVAHVDAILINDDITTQELVVKVLRDVFEMSPERATERMQETHRNGASIIGRFDAREAIRRARRATELARANGFPLRVKLEPAL